MLKNLEFKIKSLQDNFFIKSIGHCFLIMVGLILLMEATNIDLIENQYSPHIILSDWLAVLSIFLFYLDKFIIGTWRLIKSAYENNKPDSVFSKQIAANSKCVD